LVLLWLRTGHNGWLLLSAGSAVTATYLKEEGLVFVAAPYLAAAVCALGRRGRSPLCRWWLPLAVAAATLALRLPWQLWLSVQGIGGRYVRAPLPDYGLDDALHVTRLAWQQMVTLWPVPFPTFWVGLTVLLAGGLA